MSVRTIRKVKYGNTERRSFAQVHEVCDLGGFTEREKRFETPGVQPGEYPGQLTAYYDYENEYLTAKRLGAALGLRRNIKRFYIDVFARYEHGFGLEYVAQPNRVAATLSVGYNF